METTELTKTTVEALEEAGINPTDFSEENQMKVISANLMGNLSITALKEYLTITGTTVNTFLDLIKITSNNIKESHVKYAESLTDLAKTIENTLAINPENCTPEVLVTALSLYDSMRQDLADASKRHDWEQQKITTAGSKSTNMLLVVGGCLVVTGMLLTGYNLGYKSGKRQ